MKNKSARNQRHAGRAGNKLTLHPLTPDQALAALLKVKPEDVKAKELEEKANKNGSVADH